MPKNVQAALGTIIGQTRRNFYNDFGSIPAFQARPMEERLAYIDALNTLETSSLDNVRKVATSVYKMYVGMLVHPVDEALAVTMHRMLDDIAKKGAPPAYR